MKKEIWAFLAAVMLVGCNKTNLEKTRETVRSAEEMVKSTNEGFKTLDSISAVVRDTAKYNRVVVPEIEKTKRTVEKAIQNNAGKLDSLNQTINKVKDQINRSSEILKTVDSANRKLQGDGNIFDKLSTITETIGKVSGRTAPPPKAAGSTTTAPENTDTSLENLSTEMTTIESPMVKSAEMEIDVPSADEARDRLMLMLRDYGADMVSENLTENEGVRRQKIEIKVPLQYFDGLMRRISSEFPNVTAKSTASEGSTYNAGQRCDISVTFRSNGIANAATGVPSEKESTFGEKSSAALGKGFRNFGDFIVILLPILPFLIIAGLIWYFVAKAKRRKAEREWLLKNGAQKAQHQGNPSKIEEDRDTDPVQLKNKNVEDDYTRFMPKR